MTMFYYIYGMEANIGTQLKEILELNSCKDLENIDLIISSLVNLPSPWVSIIHKNWYGNLEGNVKSKIVNKCALIIFLIQGEGKPKYYTKVGDSKTPTKCWQCGTEYLIKNFYSLQKYIKTIPSNNWRIEEWVPPDIKFLPSLAILCQGFLITHFPKSSDDLSISINQALDMMGWTKFINSDNGKGIKLQQPEITEESSWWQKILGQDKKQVMEIFQKELEENLSDQMAALLDNIFKSNLLTKENAELVAQVYIQLAERLKGTIS